MFLSSSKLRVLDASGPPGHPALLMGEDTSNTGGISALDFSKDGEVCTWPHDFISLLETKGI